MNRIYKIVWSKAKNAYVVTSELAKNHTKSASGKAVKAALAAAVGMGLLMGGYTASAADNTPGAGSGVAVGTGSNAPKAENVAVGKGATIKYSNGASAATGDVAVGSDAVIDNYASQGGSIAIGKNRKYDWKAGIIICTGANNLSLRKFLGNITNSRQSGECGRKYSYW